MPRSSGRVRAALLRSPRVFAQLVNDEILQVRFESSDALRREFEKNIANRGVFVETERAFEVRQPVTVAIVLDYLDAAEPAIALEGEVVHCVPKEMASSGAMPGVAVQFDATANALRARFEPMLGPAVVEQKVEKDAEGKGRRGSKREAVRVPMRIMPTSSPPFEATSRDLSGTGVLLSIRDQVLPVGEIVRVCLWHPTGDPSVEVDGKVVREVPNKSGRIAAVAIAFDRNQAADPRIKDVIDALREAGHRSRLGGISGSLADLGLANMLQMFGSSAPQGTLVVEHEGEQGWIAFAGGNLLGAELGWSSGQDALVAMLRWGDGRFHFEASADPKVVEEATPRPLEGAILAAVCQLDEEGRDENGETMIGFSLGPDDQGSTMPIEASTTFEVDLEQEEMSRASLDKTADAILELVKAGMSVERVCGVIPEPEDQLWSSFESLVELGVLVPR